MCEREPGLFRKGKMVLSVYVDDSIIQGPSRKEIREEMHQIMKSFPGKVISPERDTWDKDRRNLVNELDKITYNRVVPATFEGTVEKRDLLGATLRYDRANHKMSITMEDQIDRVIDKFRMKGCRTVTTP